MKTATTSTMKSIVESNNNYYIQSSTASNIQRDVKRNISLPAEFGRTLLFRARDFFVGEKTGWFRWKDDPAFDGEASQIISKDSQIISKDSAIHEGANADIERTEAKAPDMNDDPATLPALEKGSDASVETLPALADQTVPTSTLQFFDDPNPKATRDQEWPSCDSPTDVSQLRAKHEVRRLYSKSSDSVLTSVTMSDSDSSVLTSDIQNGAGLEQVDQVGSEQVDQVGGAFPDTLSGDSWSSTGALRRSGPLRGSFYGQRNHKPSDAAFSLHGGGKNTCFSLSTVDHFLETDVFPAVERLYFLPALGLTKRSSSGGSSRSSNSGGDIGDANAATTTSTSNVPPLHESYRATMRKGIRVGLVPKCGKIN
jgi:hypothetical protein